MLPVQSSRLNAIGYEPFTDGSDKGNVQVEFRDGSTGYYSGVEVDIFRMFRDSPSKGRFLHDYLVKGGYPFVKTS